jgi:hypothetical protein
MAKTKYDHLIATEPFWEHNSIYPPYKKMVLYTLEDQVNFSLRLTHVESPYQMETPHTHDFDEVFAWVPCTDDLTKFDSEVELYLGEEQEKHAINKATVAHIPAGLVHAPILYKRVGTPFFFANCVLASKYTQVRTDEKGERMVTETPPESELQKMAEMRGADQGEYKGMAKTKYHHLIVTEPLYDSIYPPHKKMLWYTLEDKVNFSLTFTHVETPYQMETPHAHDFDEIFAFVPCTNDLTKFDAEVELYLGEEGEKHVINKTTVVYIPAGLVHAPILYKKVGTPLFFVNYIFASKYTQVRKDENGERIVTEMPPADFIERAKQM